MSAVPKKSFTEERRALNRSGKTAAQIKIGRAHV